MNVVYKKNYNLCVPSVINVVHDQTKPNVYTVCD